jgi:hypothetical protein
VYAAPNFVFLFAENLGIGNPPVPNNFQEFPCLANGSGAYYGAAGGSAPLGMLGQLSPWPGAVAPAGPSCPNGTDAPAVFTPVADAGPAPSVTRGTTITLDASGSRDTTVPSPMPLTFTWQQLGADGKPLVVSRATAGQRIALPAGVTPFGKTVDTPRMTFTIDKFANGQNIPDNTVLTFRVDVSNCNEFSFEGTCGSSSATTTVTITKNPTPTDTLTAATAIWRVKRSRLDVNATTSDPSAVLTVAGFGEMGPALPVATGVPAPAGDRSYTQIGVNPAPSEITVRSSLGASVTEPVTIRP